MLAFDRDVKLPLYAAAGIPECWHVDLEHGLPQPGRLGGAAIGRRWWWLGIALIGVVAVGAVLAQLGRDYGAAKRSDSTAFNQPKHVVGYRDVTALVN